MREKLLKEEEKKMKRLRFIVGLTQAVLMQSDLSFEEAKGLLRDTKRAVLSLFPDKEHVYDLIYTPRFQRIIAERYSVPQNVFGDN